MFDSTFSKYYNLILRQFCTDNFGKYIVGKYDNQDSVEIEYKEYIIIFDSYIHYAVVSGSTHETEFLRVRMEFFSPDKLTFRITNQGLIEAVQKIFGSQDIKIGNTEFDSKYFIKGNDEFKIQSLFSNIKIQNLILSLDKVRIEILENEGFFGELIREGNSVLYYNTDKEPKGITEFEQLLELFKLIIDTMQILGSTKTIENASR